MAGFYADDWLESLRARNDLVQVVSQYVPLTQKNRRFWGCCPFHSEKTPSFSVDPDKQFYYCFGCHAGGNVIHFLMNIEKLSFSEAVANLAERANIPLPQNANDDLSAQKKAQRERLYSALRDAALFFHEQLHGEAGAKAKAYLYARGLTDAQIRRFGIGYSPDRWQGLTDHLIGKGFTEKELVDCGLSVVKNAKRYDFFRDKVMFPIIDQRSRVLGFGGRVLGGDGPKYINTADTAVYNKRETLYGLNFYRSFGAERELFVVEGYMDMIAVNSAGIKNVVASLGTALTTGQVRLMRRFADTVFIAYDGDAAGRNATLRGLDLVEREGLNVRVLMLPQGQDPDDVIRRHGKAAFLSLREKALTLTEFKLELLREQSDMKTEDGRMHFAKEAAALIRNAGPVERERYVKTIARLSGFSPEALTKEVDAGKDKQSRTEPAREQPTQGDDVAQRMLYLMATDPRVRARAFLRLDAMDFATDLHRTMFEAMAELHQDDCSAALLSRFTDAKQASGVAAVLGMRHSATDKMVEDYINGLVLQRLGREIEDLNRQSKLTGADARGIAAEIQKRMMEMESIRKQRVGGAVIAPSHGGEAQ